MSDNIIQLNEGLIILRKTINTTPESDGYQVEQINIYSTKVKEHSAPAYSIKKAALLKKQLCFYLIHKYLLTIFVRDTQPTF